MQKKGIIAFYLGLFNCLFVLVYAAPEDVAIINRLLRQISEDKEVGFTQSQAHMSVQDNQRNLNRLSDVARNEQNIQQAFQREREFKSSYYIFYTAIPYMHLFQDVTRKMYRRIFGKVGALQNKAFQFIRYNLADPTYNTARFTGAAKTPIKRFLTDEIQRSGMIDDNEIRLKTILVSTNLALFANLGMTGESTWFFFNNPQPWGEVRRDWLEESIKSYGYSTQFIDEIISLTEYLKDEEGNLGSDLFQILIPKDLIDQIGYLSWRLGIPFDIELIPKILGQDVYGLSFLELKNSLMKFREEYHRKNPEVFATVSEVIRRINEGYYDLSYHLERYITIPSKIRMLNYRQARLLITNDILLNPVSGIRVYRYNNLNQEKEKVYKERLKEVINRMEQERKDRIGVKR